ncbi:MAG TPA: ribonuclease P protein component [Candidatus Cybelea sp.]|jgi:ribonuclease P protein component|nr:ribonuclease P protein component [Candidatus Cybelea sp.]
MRRVASLRRQADFARLRRTGRRVSSHSLTIYRTDLLADETSLVGITVSKAIGKAVVRNKVRRRLSAIVRELLPAYGAMRLLVVPRPSAAVARFTDLKAEVTSALGAA